MKSKKQTTKPLVPPKLAESSEAAPKVEMDPARRRRRFWFRAIALAVPLVNLALLELILRVAGFGYPTSFFLKSEVNGRHVYTENQQFSRRYFPPRLEREPQPVAFPVIKAPDTVRVFVFGESAAMGDPEPAFGFPRIAEVLLRDAVPGKRIEVINLAVTAINSHVIREIARDAADKQGDYWLVYMGNNEVVGPFGAGTVFGDQVPSLGVIRAGLALKSTRLGQLFDVIRHKLAGNPGTPKSWEGMEMFLNQQVSHDDRRLQKVYSHFETNLRDIIRIGQESGAQVVVSSVASNLKDSPPFASRHRHDLGAAQLAEWTKLYQAGIAQETAKDYTVALEFYRKAAALDNGHAELQFRMGRCHGGLERWAEARECYERARDLDALRFRADGEINRIIARVASNSPTRKLERVDVVAASNQSSPHGIPGEEFFYEHVHPNFEGNYRIARAFMERLDVIPTNAASFINSEECARRLAFTDFNRFRVLDEVHKRLQQPPFTTQLDAQQRDLRLKQQLDGLQPASFSNAVDLYEQAIVRTPDDWVLRENFATLLQDFGRRVEAEKQWRKAVQLLPHSEQACYGLANILDAQGKSKEATQYFREALLLRPGSIEARNGLALALANQGRIDEASSEYLRAIRSNPEFVEARVNFGQMLAQLGRDTEAMAQYLDALRLASNNVPTRINLGRLLSKQGKFNDAANHYREALRLDPDNAISHYNLGNTLNALGQADEAIRHFAEAVRLNPGLFEARYNWGLGLARQNRNAEALAQLAEAVRLRPGSADARFNYGVALAKALRFEEATREFQETLRLDPDNATARKFLEQAEARQNRP